jgi:hypothetical protein
MSVPQGIFPFKVIPDSEKSILTSFAGLPLVVETIRALKVHKTIDECLVIKKRQGGTYTESDYVESFIALLASGGECLDDFDRLQSDRGLKELGLNIPSSESARFFLYAFHDEEKLKDRPEQGAFIPEETEPLQNLFRVQENIVNRIHGNPTVATIDQDAVVIESAKDEAKMTYLGYRGYQPVVNYWAEMGLILKDEFRDGNVPAQHNLFDSLKASIEMLPDSVREVRYRADSAAYTHDLMRQLKQMKVRGRKITVRYAISADMTEALRNEIQRLPEDVWKPLRKVTDKGLITGRKEWAEVVFVPNKAVQNKDPLPDRYLAIRVRPSQGELFSDGNPYHYFAVVTNMRDWDGERLLRWHREKCGTVEKVHDALKNDLGGGVMPCGRFFANAAWWRLNCIAYNIISVMKQKVLPATWVTYRMKALRFLLIGVAGKVIRTGRQIYLRFSGMASVCEIFQEARRRLVHLYDTT